MRETILQKDENKKIDAYFNDFVSSEHTICKFQNTSIRHGTSQESERVSLKPTSNN